MEQLIKRLIGRLANKGMEVTSIPAYIRNFAHTLMAHPFMSIQELNSHLQVLGWDGFELDNDTFCLMLAAFEPDIACDPVNWFGHTLDSNALQKLADERQQTPGLEKDNNTPWGE
jgi:hypothetical protein